MTADREKDHQLATESYKIVLRAERLLHETDIYLRGLHITRFRLTRAMEELNALRPKGSTHDDN